MAALADVTVFIPNTILVGFVVAPQQIPIVVNPYVQKDNVGPFVNNSQLDTGKKDFTWG